MVSIAKDLTPQSWEELCVEWPKSGLSQKAFCTQRGIDYKAFVNWRGRNKTVVARIPAPAVGGRPPKTAHPLIPVQVIAGDFSHPSMQEHPRIGRSMSTSITITTPAGYSLHVEDDFNERALLRVLRTLKEAA